MKKITLFCFCFLSLSICAFAPKLDSKENCRSMIIGKWIFLSIEGEKTYPPPPEEGEKTSEYSALILEFYANGKLEIYGLYPNGERDVEHETTYTLSDDCKTLTFPSPGESLEEYIISISSSRLLLYEEDYESDDEDLRLYAELKRK
ncbi:MAG: hypothetical protein IPK76_18805 [Lewinellaceae bacterium]|nr:hypothetical protein [Lewinellaceae bacterium]